MLDIGSGNETRGGYPVRKGFRGLASLQPFRHRGFALLWTAGLVFTNPLGSTAPRSLASWYDRAG